MGEHFFVGADPGLSGGIGIIDKYGNAVGACAMPVFHTTTRAGKNRRETDAVALTDFIALHITGRDRVVAGVEDVHGIPKFSVVATSSLMQCQGIIIGAFAMAGFKFAKVPAKEWQREILRYKGGTKHDKGKSIQAAKQLFPEMSSLMMTKNSDGVAEGLLIAEYVRRKTMGACSNG